MQISEKAKERFCKDCNIPIRVYKEPFFSEKIKLYDKVYNTVEKWNRFVHELDKYKDEQSYFENYNAIKDAAINSIHNSEAFQLFNAEDMNKYAIKNIMLPGKDIFKPTNDGKIFISIDMRKANFSSLSHYDKRIFNGSASWEDFLKQFTNNEHIIHSKYIRQVILGNCNPKRHITYEKYIMDQVLTMLDHKFDLKNHIVFFSNDEIVYDMTFLKNPEYLKTAQKAIALLLNKNFDIPFRVDLFTLHRIYGTDGYCKEIYNENGQTTFDLKGLDSFTVPFVLRYLAKEDITENDKVFIYEGKLSKFIEVPEVKLDISQTNKDFFTHVDQNVDKNVTNEEIDPFDVDELDR